MLTNSSAISDIIKKDVFELNLAHKNETIWENCYRSDFASVLDQSTIISGITEL